MASSIHSSLASTSIMLLVLMFLSSTAKSDIDIPPTLSPFLDTDQLCDEVNCGRGNCSVDDTKPFNFVCKCDPGWRNTLSLSDNQNDDFQFLPCVIPNCSLELSCMPAPPPTPQIPHNNSIFDPCYWTYCGEGTCNKNHTTYYKHTCDCNNGYTNLMNFSHFPCLRNCAIGTDCRRLGVRSSDAKAPTDNDTSQGIRFLYGSFYCRGLLITHPSYARMNCYGPYVIPTHPQIRAPVTVK